MTISYGLPDPDPNSQLVEPSHADLHAATNHAVQDMTNRIVALEQAVGLATGPGGGIDQARLVTQTWLLPGALITEQTEIVLMPVVWNLGGRSATYAAAKASVLTPPTGADIIVDIVSSPALDGDAYDLSGPQDTVLINRLVIPQGETFSTTITESGFIGQHAVNTWVSAVLIQVGSGSPGSSLMVQLNRLL